MKNLETLFKKAADAYRKSDDTKWVSAFYCSQVVGNYERGATLGLASDMGLSTDTIEDMAHAYSLYNELRRMPDAALFVRSARQSHYVYMAHFRALYDAKDHYKLSNEEILKLLLDIVQGEGQISSRDVDQHAREKYGDTRTWEFFAQKANKSLTTLLNQPDLPTDGRRIINEAFSWIGDHA
jgi:hypothetical protein